MSYRTTPHDTDRMPPGVPWIIGNEAAERFSFYGMRTILVVFMSQFLHFMDAIPGTAMSETQATAHYHLFVMAVYFTPLLGAFLADVWLGRFRTIMILSLVYCAGHAALACMGSFGYSKWWLFTGLALITLGSGGIKPCVSANVGDQFGPRNQHLLTRIYNWFYFSINLGSFVSTLLTPWLLEWYGPHWAFGIPGVLMGIATLLFWMGRKQFAHIPPGGTRFFDEIASREGLVALAKLIPLFLFIAMFWALYDQTGSSWVFQSARMDRYFLGIEWLPSQIQAINPVLILSFIPLFTFLIYPLTGRVISLTPLRKIGTGLFLIAASFGIITLIQMRIDAGQTPSIAWQLLAYLVITAAEIMVSIVGLEFAYTQAPKNLKSMIMSIYLLSVFVGNFLTERINELIQIPSAAIEQFHTAAAKLTADELKTIKSAVLPGYDGKAGTDDDFTQQLDGGAPKDLIIPGQAVFEQAAATIETLARSAKGAFPDPATGNAAIKDLKDPWGGNLQYTILDSNKIRLLSPGPDRTPGTEWDLGMMITRKQEQAAKQTSWTDRFRPADPWLERRKRELGVAEAATAAAGEISFTRSAFSGGQVKLEGASYYRFFTWLMLATALVFIPFAMLYKPKAYLPD